MKTFARVTLLTVAVLFTACCGSAALQTFLLQPSSTPNVLFELQAQPGVEPVPFSQESIVLSKAGSSAAAVAPSPSPWSLELATDANSDGNVDPGDVIRVVQNPNVQGAVDVTSGAQYDVAVLEDEPAHDALHTQMTVVTWQTTWTVP